MQSLAKPPVIAITGAKGQLGFELSRSLAPLGQVVAMDRERLDLADADRVHHVITSLNPEIIVNAAAYTAVDRAEEESELAFRVNRDGPRALDTAARLVNAWCVHYSSDYVYDGRKDRPFLESDATAPLSVYGKSKCEGDLAMLANTRNVVLRTSWVHGIAGGNFLRTIMRLAAERDNLNVIDDQIGAPTAARLIADVTALVIAARRAGRDEVSGLYHLTAQGSTSWYEYARYVVAAIRRRGVATRLVSESIRPIPTSAYPQAAVRPRQSLLDCERISAQLGLCLPSWQEGVDQTLEVLCP